MHLFLRIRILSPAKIRHEFGTVRERFECPEPDHARRRDRIPRSPIDRARLLFHHPETPAANASVTVMIERGYVRVRRAGIARLLLFRQRNRLGSSDRIAVP